MVNQWFYWRDSDVLGPFSAQQLARLAAAGEILATDTVWKEGVERGVMACDVLHLFPAPVTSPGPALAPSGSEFALAPASARVAAAQETDRGPTTASEPAPTVLTTEAEPPMPWDAVRQPPTGRARAVAGKGAVIVGQDGKTVKFRKKCTTCGHEDSSWKTMTIARGTTRVAFYCPKCRKQRQVEIHGHLS